MSRNRSKAQKEAEKRYETKRAGQRTRNWAVIFYPEDLPENWTSLVNEQHFKWVEGPIHNQDLNADGMAKKPHCHALFLFENIKTFKQVEELLKEIFGESESGSIIGVAELQQATDRCAIVRYMAHMDNPEKAQYDVAGIVGHNGADPVEMLKDPATETRKMIVAMEKFIKDNGIIELIDFTEAIRDDYPEWHTILTTRLTVYFSALIRSCRHKAMQPPRIIKIDSETGEVVGVER